MWASFVFKAAFVLGLVSQVALLEGFLKRLVDVVPVLLDLVCLSFFISFQTDWWWSDQILCGANTNLTGLLQTMSNIMFGNVNWYFLLTHMWIYVCACVCVCACVRVRVCVCANTWARSKNLCYCKLCSPCFTDDSALCISAQDFSHGFSFKLKINESGWTSVETLPVHLGISSLIFCFWVFKLVFMLFCACALSSGASGPETVF